MENGIWTKSAGRIESDLMNDISEKDVVTVSRATGRSPILLVCEHASNFIPTEFDDLGLNNLSRYSHVVWDPGALGVARSISAELDATLVASNVSRLVYDCNRPPEAFDAMPAVNEAYEIPGNAGLSVADRSHRTEAYYKPFQEALTSQVEAKVNPVIVTIHSFTPIYNGTARETEIGILHDVDTRLADSVLAHADRFNVRRNQPYGPKDGVTHTLKQHAIPKRHLNVMIEIRNDLIQTEVEQASMGLILASWITKAVSELEATK